MVLALFRGLRWLDVSVEVADLAAQLARTYARSDPRVDTVDFLVAASAQLLDARLVTRNVGRFPMFPDFEPPY
jgi:predicted nucleic acid-binding protein